MVKFEFNLRAAITGAIGVLPNASKDVVSPVITGVLVTGGGFMATDRFTVGCWRFEGVEGYDVFGNLDEGVLVSREGLDWVSKLKVNSLRGVSRNTPESVLDEWRLRFVGQDDGGVLIEVVTPDGSVERSQTFDVVMGSYPPVGRIVSDFVVQELAALRLNPVFIERATTFMRKCGEKEQPILFEMGGKNESDKPNPVRFTAAVEGQGVLEVLVQPNLFLK